MLCECCELKEGLTECKECGQSPGQWGHLCEECSSFIHRGSFKNHQVIPPELKKKRDDAKSKLTVFKESLSWEQKVTCELQEVRRDLQDRQTKYENGIKTKVTELQQKLKCRAMKMIKELQEISAEKTKYLDDLIKQYEENVKERSEFESKFGQMIDCMETSYELGNELEYKFVEWDKTSFPKLSIPFRIDYKSIEDAANAFALDMSVTADDSDKVKSIARDVSLQSRVDTKGVFWIHVDFSEEMLDELLSISFDIKTKLMLDRNWKTFEKLSSTPEVGEHVYGLWPYDNKWYRVRIEELFLEKSEANVVFTDFGNSEKISFSGLLPIGDHKVSDLPYQAIECTLFPEPKEIPLNVKFEFTDMIAGGPLHCTILCKKKFGDKEVTHIELIKDMPDGSQLNLREYLDKRCDSKKNKVDHPFTSRDIRLLENPGIFDKPKTPKSSPMRPETAATTITDESADANQTKEPDNRVGQEGVDTQNKLNHCDVEANGSAESVPLANGHATPETKTYDDNQGISADSICAQDLVDGRITLDSDDMEESFDLPRASVNPGEYIQIVVENQLHSEGFFWAVLHRTKKQQDDFDRLCLALRQCGETSSVCTTIKEGSMVLANHNKDWRRAKVESVIDGKVKLRLTDYGTSCKTTGNLLRVLPLNFCEIPTQGICCTIKSAKLATFGKDSCLYFQKLVSGKVLTAQILSIGPKNSFFEVSLMELSGPEPLDIVDLLAKRAADLPKRGTLSDSEPDVSFVPMSLGSSLIPMHDVLGRPALSDDESWMPNFVDVSLYTQDGQHQQNPTAAEFHQAAVEAPTYQRANDSLVPQDVQRESGDARLSGADHRGSDRRGAYREQRNERGWQRGNRGEPGQRVCYHCGDPNHMAKDCANRPPGGGGGGGGGRSNNRSNRRR